MPSPSVHLRVIAVLLLLVSCGQTGPGSDAAADPRCEREAVVEVVEQLGGRLQRVSLLAPDSLLRPAIRETYGGLATPELLAAWVAAPDRAPGRMVSSPWPDRIDVHSVSASAAGGCRVEGEVVYVARAAGSAQPQPVARHAVEIGVREADGGWRIAAYREARSPGWAEADSSTDAPADDAAAADPSSTSDSRPDLRAPSAPAGDASPADVIRAYYAAIDARELRRAYELWGDAGRASGQTFDAFAAGFERTGSVEVEVGEPGRIGAAAGSRYVTVPVTIRAVTEDGETQRFEGTYTLRRAVVEGGSPAARRWHLYSADIAASP